MKKIHQKSTFIHIGNREFVEFSELVDKSCFMTISEFNRLEEISLYNI